jgi:hypothetical protein
MRYTDPVTARRRPLAVRALVLGLAVLAVLGVSGCGGTAADDEARRTVDAFVRAIADGDGATACGLLAASTRTTVEDTTGDSCERGVVEQAVADPGATTGVDVFGTTAQVRLAHDTVFLTRADGGWRVLAASCTPRGEHPYDCDIEGG